MSPLSRDELPVDGLIEHFLFHTREEEPQLAARFEDLDDEGRLNLAGVLGRFDRRHRGELDATQRALAARVLRRLHEPSTETLVLTNKVLDYLDVNANAVLEDDELELCVECLEVFSKAESRNETLSRGELELLYGTLRQLDGNDNRVLDPHERRALLGALRNGIA